MRHESDAEQRISPLTLEEKAALTVGASAWTTAGVDRADIPSITMADGPHGLRLVDQGDAEPGDPEADTPRPPDGMLGSSKPATCFPTASALGASWDRALVAEVARAIAREARAAGVQVLLGPGLNLKRTPLCGRNFEYFSEDPVLTGELGTAFVTAAQAEGVGTAIKHFAANLQEHRRMTIDVITDERSLRELELAGFEDVVRRAKPWAVMGAYNRINGTYACEHPWLLTDVLRGEWGFEGLVVTDWGAMDDRVAGLVAGCDLQMPGPAPDAIDRIVTAVNTGQLDEAVVDVAARRVTTLVSTATDRSGDHADAPIDVDAHHDLARRAAAAGTVLLRNEDDVLPLQPGQRVALLGALAVDPRYQGTGSSRVEPTRVDTLRDALTSKLGVERVTFARGYDAPDAVDTALQSSAVAAAGDADVAVIVAGLPDGYENEGADRTHLHLPPSHNALIAAVAAVQPRVVVVLANGAPVAMPWVDDVAAVVEGYLGGQAAGSGLADVLTGGVDPGGRLAETFPRHLDDVPAVRHAPGGPSTVEHREGLYVGYRYHTTVGGDVLFPFGHGLSYTTFEHGNVEVDPGEIDVHSLETGTSITVSVEVTNTGQRTGSHVVQVYIRDVESACYRPDRELKAFDKIVLEPGETRTVSMRLPARAFAYWHPDHERWVVEPGTFEVLVGSSVADIAGTATVDVTGEPFEPREEPAVYRRPGRYLDVDAVSFSQLLGRPIPPNPPLRRPFDRNTPIGAVAGTPFGRVLVPIVERRVRSAIGDDRANEAMVRSLVDEAPLRTLTMTGGLSDQQLDTIIDLVNGRWVSGGERVVRALRASIGRR